MTEVNDTQKARFDAVLPQHQKRMFERATALGGFRNLTEFVFHSAQEKADEIIERHETILASQRDKEAFFDALMNPPKPNRVLLDAAQDYKKQTQRP